jgi:hypothetical protein
MNRAHPPVTDIGEAPQQLPLERAESMQEEAPEILVAPDLVFRQRHRQGGLFRGKLVKGIDYIPEGAYR